jgi:hypothetical protein
MGLGVFDTTTAQASGETGAALIEDDLIARLKQRTEDIEELFGEWDRSLSRSAGERYHSDPAVAERGAVAADRQRDRARHEAARVERDGEVAARELAAFAAWTEVDLRPGGRAQDAGAQARAQERRHELA